MVKATESTPVGSPDRRAGTVVVEIYSLMEMLAWVATNLGLSVVKTFLQVLVPSSRG